MEVEEVTVQVIRSRTEPDGTCSMEEGNQQSYFQSLLIPLLLDPCCWRTLFCPLPLPHLALMESGPQDVVDGWRGSWERGRSLKALLFLPLLHHEVEPLDGSSVRQGVDGCGVSVLPQPFTVLGSEWG